MIEIFDESIYDMKMREKVSVSNCSHTLVKRYDCIMRFIATKMKCQPNWEKKFYDTNEQLQICHSIEDLKEYFKIKLDIYRGIYDSELEHCHQRNCHEHIWQPELQNPLVSNFAPRVGLKHNDTIALYSFVMSDKEVNSLKFLKSVNTKY